VGLGYVRCNLNRWKSPSTRPVADRRLRREGHLAVGASTCRYSTESHLLRYLDIGAAETGDWSSICGFEARLC